MVKRGIIIICLLTLVATVIAQQNMRVEAAVWSNYRLAAVHSGFDPGLNGAGFALGLNTMINGRFYTNISGELGVAGTGFYIAGKTGIEMEIYCSSDRISFTPGISLLQGAGLFRPQSLYMWGIEQKNIFAIRLNNAAMPGLLFGWRYYGFPGYFKYSEINQFLDLRVGLNYRF